MSETLSFAGWRPGNVSDHCWFENGFNIGDVQPVYDFCSGE